MPAGMGQTALRQTGGVQRSVTRTVALGAVVIIVMTVLAYIPALRGGFIWDDDFYVTANRNLKTTAGLARIWTEPRDSPQYYPLVFTTFWLEYRLWLLAPFGYHATNVALHIINALLLWAILSSLNIPGAWLAAAMFALHPAHVESVAWITERKNVLSGSFYLLSALFWLRFTRLEAAWVVGEEDDESPGARDWRAYSLSILFFVCALLSKTVTASLPVVLLLLVWMKRGKVALRDVIPLLPMVALGMASGLTTVWLERHRVGATGIPWDLSPLERVLVAGRALWFYAGKLLWPDPLSFIYPRWRIDAGAWWQFLFPLAAVALATVLWALRRTIGRGPLTAALCFAVTLAPALGFFNVYPMRYSWVADHFQYLASICLLALFAAVLLRRVETSAAGRPWTRAHVGAFLTVATLLLTPLGALTWRQGRMYRSPEALWTATIASSPDAFLPHLNLGAILGDRGEHEEALRHYREAIRLYPEFTEAWINMTGVLYNLRKVDEAGEAALRAVSIDPGSPQAWLNLGTYYKMTGQPLKEQQANARALASIGRH